MSKLIKAVNSMIIMSDMISNVIPEGVYYFFIFDKKHYWSIAEINDEIVLFYFPNIDKRYSFDQIINMFIHNEIEHLSFSSGEINTYEAKKSLRELFLTVKSKAFNIDKVFDEIIDKEENTPEEDLPF